MSDTDIDFLDPAAAREYVLNFIIALKRVQKDRAVAEEELGHWQRRVKLAEARSEPILQKSAEARAGELKSRCEGLLAEERQLAAKVDVLKEKLRSVVIRSSLHVDADALLAQLTAAAGDPSADGQPPGRDLDAQLREAEADEALQQLKRKMRGEGR